MERMLKQKACYRADVSLFHARVPFSALFFFSAVLIAFYQKKDCLCLMVWEQLSKRDRESTNRREDKKKKIYWLTEEGQSVICQPRTYDEWQRDWQANT